MHFSASLLCSFVCNKYAKPLHDFCSWKVYIHVHVVEIVNEDLISLAVNS